MEPYLNTQPIVGGTASRTILDIRQKGVYNYTNEDYIIKFGGVETTTQRQPAVARLGTSRKISFPFGKVAEK